MRFGSMCSGIEAASVAWGPLGWSAAWFAEIDPFASAVLKHHYPEVENLGDMTQIPALLALGLIEAPDILCAGTPCQAFSVAGLRRSLDDARGNLSLTFCEIADAIDQRRADAGAEPCIVFWENVPGVLNTKDNAFGCFLAGLAGEDEPLLAPGGKWANAGAVFGPARAVAWRVLDAQYFGVAQRRRRVFVVASAREGFDPAAVLFEFDGVRRDSAPRREAGEEPAGGATAGAGGSRHNSHWNGQAHPPLSQASQTRAGGIGGSNQEIFEQGGVGLVPAVAGTLTASFGRLLGQSGQDADHGHSHLIADTTHTLRGEGFKHFCHRCGEPSGQTCALCGLGDCVTAMPVAFNWNAQPEQLPSPDRDTSINDGLTCSQQAAVAYTTKLHNTGSNNAGKLFEERTTCLDANSPPPALLTAMQVRRLTPRECERLQGFPDDYTAILWRGKPADQCPDGPRYKALGNSWAVPNVRWIGARIMAHVDIC